MRRHQSWEPRESQNPFAAAVLAYPSVAVAVALLANCHLQSHMAAAPAGNIVAAGVAAVAVAVAVAAAAESCYHNRHLSRQTTCLARPLHKAHKLPAAPTSNFEN